MSARAWWRSDRCGQLGTGHYIADDFGIPFAGDWILTTSVLVDDTTRVTGETEVPIR